MAAKMGAFEIVGHRLLDTDGNTVGKIGRVYFDDETDLPKWITVRSGLLGSRECFVPLRGARLIDNELQVPYDRLSIREAPYFGSDQHVSADEESQIYRHYGIDASGVPEQREAEGLSAGGSQIGRHRAAGDDEPGLAGLLADTDLAFDDVARGRAPGLHEMPQQREPRSVGGTEGERATGE